MKFLKYNSENCCVCSSYTALPTYHVSHATYHNIYIFFGGGGAKLWIKFVEGLLITGLPRLVPNMVWKWNVKKLCKKNKDKDACKCQFSNTASAMTVIPSWPPALLFLIFCPHSLLFLVVCFPGLLIFWSPDLLVSWSTDLLVSWSPDLLISWSPGLLISWSPGLLISWSQLLSSQNPAVPTPSKGPPGFCPLWTMEHSRRTRWGKIIMQSAQAQCQSIRKSPYTQCQSIQC